MSEVRFSPGIAKVSLGDDSKRANSREGPSVLAVQFIAMVAIDDKFPFGPGREFKIVDERITRVVITRVIGPLTCVLANVVRVIVRRSLTELDPMRLEITRGILISISRIVIEHRPGMLFLRFADCA